MTSKRKKKKKIVLENKDSKTMTEKVLEILQSGADGTAYFLDIFFSSYYTSYKKLRQGRYKPSPKFETNWVEWYRERQSFYSFLNYLKRDGLIKKKGREWDITRKGQEKLNKLTYKNNLVLKAKITENPIIISYDIPEELKKERGWLRDILKLFDFNMVHKSVWIGNCYLPEECIHQLKEKKLIPHIHIFEVGKSGTLKSLL